MQRSFYTQIITVYLIFISIQTKHLILENVPGKEGIDRMLVYATQIQFSAIPLTTLEKPHRCQWNGIGFVMEWEQSISQHIFFFIYFILSKTYRRYLPLLPCYQSMTIALLMYYNKISQQCIELVDCNISADQCVAKRKWSNARQLSPIR